MAVHARAPKQTNWWVWGGVAVAALIALSAIGYGFDWFVTGTNEGVPAVEQSAPVTN